MTSLLKQTGFTLLEMLLASAIFALVGMAAVGVLLSVTNSDTLSTQHSARLQQIQHSMLLLERDFMQISARYVRINGEPAQNIRLQGEKYFLESDDHGVRFTRQGWRNPGMILPRSDIQVVSYRLEQGQLQRLFTLYPDAVTGTEARVQTLLENVTAFEILYWHDEKWQESWQNNLFPAAVQVTLQHEQLGTLQRLFILPDALLAESTE